MKTLLLRLLVWIIKLYIIGSSTGNFEEKIKQIWKSTLGKTDDFVELFEWNEIKIK